MARPTPNARRRYEGLVALGVVQLVFGTFAVTVKLAIDGGAGFSPRAIIVWRVLGGALVLGTLAAAKHGRAFWPRWSDFPRLAACSLLGILGNQLLAVEGTARVQAMHAGILFTLIPVFTYAVALIVRQERVSGRRVLGIGMALVGAVLLIVARQGGVSLESAPAPVMGGLMIAGNCLCYATYLVIARPLLERLPTRVVIAWAFILSVPLLPIVGAGVDYVPDSATPTAIGALVFLVLVNTTFGYLLNAYALARVSASTTAVFTYIQPLVAIAGAALLLGESIGVEVFLCAPLLLAGVGLVALGRRT